jgi:hypothetical protein
MKTLGKVAGIIGLLIIIAFAGSIGKIIGKSIGKSTIKNYEQGKVDGAIEEKLIEISKKINSQLPIMVDPDTRIDTTICYGEKMLYKYTMVNYSENELDKSAFKNEMATMLAKNQCNNGNMVKMLKMGVEYYYVYSDKNGTHIATINISKKNCGL